MPLVDDVKVALRVSSPMFDPEVSMLVDAALADMERAGVPRELMLPGVEDPLVKQAVTLFAKSRFGYDNSEAPRFEESYRQAVKDMVNSPTSYGGVSREVELHR